MRKTTHLDCDVTLPATGVDEIDNPPIGITENLHMPRLIMFFTSFDAVILPFEKCSEVEQSDRHVCTMDIGLYQGGGDVDQSRREPRRAVVHKAASHNIIKLLREFILLSLHKKI